jgi:hypothetical protein
VLLPVGRLVLDAQPRDRWVLGETRFRAVYSPHPFVGNIIEDLERCPRVEQEVPVGGGPVARPHAPTATVARSNVAQSNANKRCI